MTRAHGLRAAPRRVRVLVVDDSAPIRDLLTALLSADPGIDVVGTAEDPFVARELIKQLRPDVLTLDVEMPRMDGLTFLQNLMRLRPMPVVMVSSLTRAGASVTLEALALGAIDFVTKPDAGVGGDLGEYAAELRAKVRSAATVRVARLDAIREQAEVAPGPYRAIGRVIAIGASTGGTEALREVLAAMPADAPPILVAQHIPGQFSSAFAERLDRNSRMTVVEAADGCKVVPGHAYVAPGGRHLRLQRSAGYWFCRIGDDAAVSGHRPSVDVLFESVALHAGSNATAALLTGMGDDGARGLLRLHQAGAVTIAQDQASSIVWGMPGAAVGRGAAQEVVPLNAVAARLLAGTNRDVG